MPTKSRKRGDDPTPHERHIRDPKTNEVKAVSRPIARSTTMPPKSTKPKAPLTFYEMLGLFRDSKGKQILVRPNPSSTTIPPSFTKYKEAPRPLEEVARDPKPERPVPLRPKVCSTTIPPESKEKGDPLESLKAAPDYITMQSKGYDKNKGRATRRDRTHTMTEGSAVEEAAADGGAGGPEAAAREDTDDGDSDDGDIVDGSTTEEDSDDGHTIDGDSGIRYVVDGDSSDGYTDDEDTDDEDAVGVQTGGRGPTEMEADGGDGGQYAGYRVIVEEVIKALARRLAARRDDARAYAADRETPTRESRESEFGGGEPVRRDHGRTHRQYGAPRMEPDDRMPPLEVGDDNFVANRNWELDPESVRFERQQRLAPEEGWEVAQHMNASRRAALQRRNIARQREAQRIRDSIEQRLEEQRLEEQHHGGQHHGQVGQDRGAQNSTTTTAIPSRDDPPPAYTRDDQGYMGPNRHY